MSVMLATMKGSSVSRSRTAVKPSPDHLPVLVDELLGVLKPQAGEVVVDTTLGGGGVSEAFLQHVLPGGRVLAFDRDPAAVRRAQERFARYGSAFEARVGRFSRLESLLDEAGAVPDVVVMDLGISSLQLDDPRRGFSFQQEGPLDMRMDPTSGGVTAADLLRTLPESDLADLLFQLGDERRSRAIARAVVERRKTAPLTTTTELAELCQSAIPRRLWPPRIHPATRSFLALRIAVNEELDEIREGIAAAIQSLRPGGRFGVISFHSLEDSLAKRLLHVLAQNCVCPPQQPVCTCAHRATISLLNRKVIKPSLEEVAANPRARSARLRAAVKLPDPGP